MNPGDVAYVQYHADPGVFHTRLLTADLGQDEWMIVTPDRDIYPEIPSANNPNFSRFYHAPDGRVPRQMPVRQVYAFAPMDAQQYGDLLRLRGQPLGSLLKTEGRTRKETSLP